MKVINGFICLISVIVLVGLILFSLAYNTVDFNKVGIY